MTAADDMPARAGAGAPPTGNLDDAVAGNYDFSIGAIIGEGWARTSGMKRITILAGLAVFVVVLVVTTGLGIALSVFSDTEQPGLLAQLVVQLALMAVIYPFLAGFLMLGIRRAADLPVSFETPFSYLEYAVPVVVAAVLLTFMTTIGLMLLVIPGIYLSVAYLFALPLVIDKGLSPWAALEASRKAVSAHWFKTFAVFLLLGILLLVGAFTLIGWIWTAPLWYAAYGVLYRTIFGVDAVDPEPVPA